VNKISLCIALVALALLAACSDRVEVSPPPTKKVMQVTRDTADAATIAIGRGIYEANCAACHASGAMHAPKVGNKADWEEPISDGLDTLVENAIKGIGQMPAKGGNPQLNEAEIRAAIQYMIQQSK